VPGKLSTNGNTSLIKSDMESKLHEDVTVIMPRTETPL